MLSGIDTNEIKIQVIHGSSTSSDGCHCWDYVSVEWKS
jgi:hypothetical protein